MKIISNECLLVSAIFLLQELHITTQPSIAKQTALRRYRGRKTERKPSTNQVTTLSCLLPSLPLRGEGIYWDSVDASPINSAERRNYHPSKKKKLISIARQPARNIFLRRQRMGFGVFVICCGLCFFLTPPSKYCLATMGEPS